MPILIMFLFLSFQSSCEYRIFSVKELYHRESRRTVRKLLEIWKWVPGLECSDMILTFCQYLRICYYFRDDTNIIMETI